MKFPASLRSRFLLIVLVGAILPLAGIGFWLANSSVRAAEALLRSQLDAELTSTMASVEERWSLRQADLAFLADNDVVVRSLTQRQVQPSRSDSAFMSSTYSAAFADNFPGVVIRDGNGVVVWKLEENARHSDGTPLRFVPPFAERSRVAMTMPSRNPAGQTVGTVQAEMRLDAVLPRDSVHPVVNGSELRIRDSAGALLRGTAERSGSGLMSVEKVVPGLPLSFALVAPTAPFVSPFKRGARIGLVLLIAVAVIALVLTAFFTARLTHSLETMADAADAIAGGNLSQDIRIESGQSEEVRRLGASFQTMTGSLRQTLHDLSRREALAAVGEFAATMSHEIRNGLSSVRLDLQRIDERIPREDSTKPLIERALRSVQRLNGSATGALGVARGDREKWKVFELAPVLEAAADAAEDSFAKSGGSLDRRLDAGRNSMIRGDAGALEQLFVNVLMNAGQASTPGSRATLEMSAIGAGRIEVAVRDSGVGIEPAQLEMVGKPFYSSKAGGTGLGLSIARKIVAAHGGELEIESTPQSGTAVRVWLPVEGQSRSLPPPR